MKPRVKSERNTTLPANLPMMYSLPRIVVEAMTKPQRE